MSKQTAISRFILSPSEANSAELYQSLLRGIEGYQRLGEQLAYLAEQSHIFRQFDRVREYGLILSTFPIKRFQAMGFYYLAVATNSRGKGDQDTARKLFEIAADRAPDFYRAKALLSLGAIALHAGDYQSEIRYLAESAKASKDNSTTVRAYLGMAIYKSMEGFHQRALVDLENLYNLARHSQPIVFFDYLNSLAVELGEVGRKDEARNIMRVVLASPFASAYPEWRETAEELRPSKRSFVAAGGAHTNVLPLPERAASELPSEQPGPARVFDLAKWKKQIAKQNRDKKIEKDLSQMSGQDILFKLLELITENRPNHAQMRALLDFALSLFSQPSERDPDGPAS